MPAQPCCSGLVTGQLVQPLFSYFQPGCPGSPHDMIIHPCHCQADLHATQLVCYDHRQDLVWGVVQSLRSLETHMFRCQAAFSTHALLIPKQISILGTLSDCFVISEHNLPCAAWMPLHARCPSLPEDTDCSCAQQQLLLLRGCALQRLFLSATLAAPPSGACCAPEASTQSPASLTQVTFRCI